MALFGSSLSSYPNLDYLEGETPQDILDQINQIRMPSRIVSIYFDGKKHIAWINLTKKIKKTKKGVNNELK